MVFIFVKFASVETSLRKSQLAFTMLQIVEERAFVAISSWVEQSSLPLHLSKHPVTFVPFSIFLDVLSRTMLESFFPIAAVKRTSLVPGHDADSAHFPIAPLSKVNCGDVSTRMDAVSRLLVTLELAKITRAI